MRGSQMVPPESHLDLVLIMFDEISYTLDCPAEVS
jgi:hypothetical protein